MSRVRGNVLALAVALALDVVLAVLLSPLGFESRPPTALTVVGYAAIAAVFIGAVLDLAALVLLFRSVRPATLLAIIGSVLLLVPNVADQTGSFFSQPIPPAVNVLEYVFIVALLATVFLAWRIRRGDLAARG